MDFVFPGEHRIKEVEKLDKYQGLARELKKLQNTELTVIPIVIGALGTATKNLEKRIDELKIRRIETISTKNQLRSLEESWRPEKTFCNSRFQ